MKIQVLEPFPRLGAAGSVPLLDFLGLCLVTFGQHISTYMNIGARTNLPGELCSWPMLAKLLETSCREGGRLWQSCNDSPEVHIYSSNTQDLLPWLMQSFNSFLIVLHIKSHQHATEKKPRRSDSTDTWKRRSHPFGMPSLWTSIAGLKMAIV